MRRILPLMTLLAALIAGGCDYSIVEQELTGPGATSNVSIVVTPGAATVEPGRTVQLRAVVTGATDTTAIWNVVSGPGRVYPDGLFVAPADVTGTAVVRARASADTSKSATAFITISHDTTGGGGQRVNVSVSPASWTMIAGGTLQFTATVTGSANTSVSWSIVAGGIGTIDAAGLYVAPSSIPSEPIVVTVQAVSAADAAAIGRATVTLVLPPDPNRICFDREILPIFVSNCAMSGCHDPAKREAGFDFTKASGILRGVKPGDAQESKIYKLIIGKKEDGDRVDDDDIMPPPPASPLSAEQIELIRRWIDAGADIDDCPPPVGGCDTVNVTYASTIRPVIQNACLGCHTGGTDFNRNVDLSTHAGVSRVAQSGQLDGSISHAQGFVAMPQSGARLDDCTITKFRTWIGRGAPNN